MARGWAGLRGGAMAPHTHRDYAMAGEDGQAATRVEPVGFVAALPAAGERGRRAAAFRRAVACMAGCAGAALVVAVVLGASGGGRGETTRTVLANEGDPSDVAARIIASAKGFNREVDDLVPHEDPEAPGDTRLEANYPALAESIVKHGRGIVYRLIHGPPKQEMEGIPMPVDDEEPPDEDGLDDDAGGEPPQTTPTPDPSADQGGVAEDIIVDSNKAREQNLVQADTNGLCPPRRSFPQPERRALRACVQRQAWVPAQLPAPMSRARHRAPSSLLAAHCGTQPYERMHAFILTHTILRCPRGGLVMCAFAGP